MRRHFRQPSTRLPPSQSACYAHWKPPRRPRTVKKKPPKRALAPPKDSERKIPNLSFLPLKGAQQFVLRSHLSRHQRLDLGRTLGRLCAHTSGNSMKSVSEVRQEFQDRPMPQLVSEEPPDFSLVMGGPVFQLFRRSHLAGDHMELLARRILVITLLAWLPLLLLSAFGHHLFSTSVKLPFLRDIEVHVRLLAALRSSARVPTPSVQSFSHKAHCSQA